MDNHELTEKEKIFFDRMVKRKKLFFILSMICVLLGITLFIYHLLIAKDLNGTRFMIIILVLLSGKMNLRQYKSAVIFYKLSHVSLYAKDQTRGL